MNEFGHIADDLTFIQERLDSDDLRKYAARLQKALQRAFVEACLASRTMRYAEEAEEEAHQAPARRARKAGGARATNAAAKARTAGSGVAPRR